jgi:hypothetical protein
MCNEVKILIICSSPEHVEKSFRGFRWAQNLNQKQVNVVFVYVGGAGLVNVIHSVCMKSRVAIYCGK